MAEAVPDGLASLSTQRNRARRSMPPPRHPMATEVANRAVGTNQIVSGPEQPNEPVVAATSLATVPAPSPPEITGVLEAATTAPVSPASRAPNILGAPVKVTLYVDRDLDEFMEAARVEGLIARPKVDISRSAVVRMALRRLMSEMSAAEVKTVLEKQNVRNSGPGRKRR